MSDLEHNVELFKKLNIIVTEQEVIQLSDWVQNQDKQLSIDDIKAKLNNMRMKVAHRTRMDETRTQGDDIEQMIDIAIAKKELYKLPLRILHKIPFGRLRDV